MFTISRGNSQTNLTHRKAQHSLPDDYGLQFLRHEWCLKVLFQRRDRNGDDPRVRGLLLFDPNTVVSASLAELVAPMIAVIVIAKRSDFVAVRIVFSSGSDKNSRAASVGSERVVDVVSCVSEVSERYDERFGGAPGAVGV
jgi:hypothetical protein